MIKKFLWLIAGFVGLKLVNEIGYILINVPGEGVIFCKALMPALAGSLLLGLCLVKGDVFFEYSKKLGTNKLNQTYKILLVSLGISIFFMVAYYFANSENKISKLESPNISSTVEENKSNDIKNTITSEVCSGQDFGFYRFKVNVNKNVVLREIHAKDNSDKYDVSSEAYKNCQVVDRLNWVCGDSPKKYMVDGRFYIDWPDGTKEICVK